MKIPGSIRAWRRREFFLALILFFFASCLQPPTFNVCRQSLCPTKKHEPLPTLSKPLCRIFSLSVRELRLRSLPFSVVSSVKTMLFDVDCHLLGDEVFG